MFKKMSLIAIVSCLSFCMNTFGQDNAVVSSGPVLHIDIPTRLGKANIVVDFGHAVYGGDFPLRLETFTSSRTIFVNGTPRARWL